MFLLLLCLCVPLKRFSGRLLGVSASAVLDETAGLARLELSGVPLGGRLRGTAWFGDEGVVLDPQLRRSLGLRLVSVRRVRMADRELLVTLGLPVLGTRTVTLHEH